MKRFSSSVVSAVIFTVSLMMGVSLAGCGGGGNFETSEPYSEATGEELEAMEESPGEQSN